ncbi:non-structural protein [Murine hepatitis virus strain 2]|uniref:Non-structural protein n=1 Tax=Murine coronavirus (strain 2) TaxID=76344 RepID=Q9PY99_CVM2|nr:non-structural protein [Murine hepatitis virus strain 2]AAF69340.1 truncated non-structural protein [Murine hepatitis virus]
MLGIGLVYSLQLQV